MPLTATLTPRAAALVRGLAACLFVGLLALLVATFAMPDSEFVDDVLQNSLYLGAAALCAARGVLVPHRRAAWLTLAAGMLSWTLGAVISDTVLASDATPPFPSAADAAYLAFYPAAYVALGLFLRSRVRRVLPVAWLDGVIGASAVAALAAAVVFEPVRESTGGSFAAVAVNLAYPLADLTLAAFLVVLFAFERWRPSREGWLLAIALAILTVADSIFLYRAATGLSGHVTLLSMTWPLAMTLIALAAWQSSDRRHSPRVDGRRAMAVPTLFSLLGIGLLIYGNFVPLGVLATVLATAAVSASALRAGLSFRAVQQLAISRHQAVTDELTGLPNRRLLYDRLDAATLGADKAGEPLAVLLIDLDGFKEVNDSLGHKAGDLLLRRIGPRLAEVTGATDTLARLGGDEFGVLLPGADATGAQAAAARLRAALDRPFEIEGLSLMVDASVGIAVHPEHGNDAETLLQHADVAMYQAKGARTGCEVYRPERDAHSRDRLGLAGGLRRAIDSGELVLHYQPKEDLRTGKVTGAEALVRWLHPERGLLAPGEFLPAAEHTALMRPLTLHVVDQALAQCRRWHDAGLDLTVAVNLAVANVIDRGFPDAVAELLERHGVAPNRLQLEITENVVMADPARGLEVLDRLRTIGVSLSLDDFGTGHSSLAYLTRLAVDELKIDRSFVWEMGSDAGAAAIVRTTVELARALGLRVVAEGAEDATTWEQLRKLGCDLSQGYHLSPPLPAIELESWLAARRMSAAVRPAAPRDLMTS
jgi:diguanylate cyclase (GGDEF)-like protein